MEMAMGEIVAMTVEGRIRELDADYRITTEKVGAIVDEIAKEDGGQNALNNIFEKDNERA